MDKHINSDLDPPRGVINGVLISWGIWCAVALTIGTILALIT